MASRDTVEMAWKGMKYAAILPILGSTLGAWKLCNCFQHIAASRGELLRRATASCVMLGVPVVYGFCVAAMIHVHLDKRDFDSGNASFAAGLLVGLTGGFCSAAVGVFSDKAIRAVLRQPRLFAAMLLILVSLVTLTKSATFGDVPYTDAVQLTSCASCANLGGIFATATIGASIMEMGVERPGYVMRYTVLVVAACQLGIYGFVGSLIPHAATSMLGTSCLAGGWALGLLGQKACRDVASADGGFSTEAYRSSLKPSGVVIGLVTIVLVYNICNVQPVTGTSPNGDSYYLAMRLMGAGHLANPKLVVPLSLLGLAFYTTYAVSGRHHQREPRENQPLLLSTNRA